MQRAIKQSLNDAGAAKKQDSFYLDEDSQLSQAIMASMNPQDSIEAIASYEPLNAEQRIRQSGDIVGLKNIGNTCYFNSIL